jgi:hypothetical protein
MKNEARNRLSAARRIKFSTTSRKAVYTKPHFFSLTVREYFSTAKVAFV